MSGRRREGGSILVEVLVTLVIVALGLFGLAKLQVQLQTAEVEASQRAQALLLAEDMARRLATNRGSASAYVAELGADACPAATSTLAQRDLRAWCLAVQGASVTADSGATRAGGLIGGRGCVQASGSDYLVTVAWQGLTPLSAPSSSLTCGASAFDTSAHGCTNDRCRRVVTTVVRIATL